MSEDEIEHRTSVAASNSYVPTRQLAGTIRANIRCANSTILKRELNWYDKVEERIP